MSFLLVGALAAGIAGAVGFKQVSQIRQRRRWRTALEGLDGAQVRDARGGWLECDLLIGGRSGEVRVQPQAAASGARWAVSFEEIGTSFDDKLALRPAAITGDVNVFGPTIASESVRRAMSTVFGSDWNLERLDILEGGLVAEGYDATVTADVVAERAARYLNQTAAVVEAIAEAQKFRRPSPRCPLCEGASLRTGVGHLLESVCENCEGRLLPPAAVEQLFGIELGMTPGELKDGLSQARGLTCPGCRTKMGPMLVQQKILDLCPGCGSMWLDRGELTALSDGRYPENLG